MQRANILTCRLLDDSGRDFLVILTPFSIPGDMENHKRVAQQIYKLSWNVPTVFESSETSGEYQFFGNATLEALLRRRKIQTFAWTSTPIVDEQTNPGRPHPPV